MAKRQTPRSFVGSEIRRAREAITPRMSRKTLGEQVSVSGELVAAWESGRQAILIEHIVNLVEVLDFGSAPDLLVRIVEELVNGEAAPEFENKWIDAEELATSLCAFESGVVPGLLQTPEYARAVLSDEAQVARRMNRQKILEVEAAPTFVVVLGEAVLHLAVDSREVMAEQLNHLAESAERDNIFVQTIPMSDTICGKFTGAFMVATLDNGRNVGYGTTVIGSGEVFESPEDLAELRNKFDRFRARALPEQQSIDLIRRIEEQWK